MKEQSSEATEDEPFYDRIEPDIPLEKIEEDKFDRLNFCRFLAKQLTYHGAYEETKGETNKETQAGRPNFFNRIKCACCYLKTTLENLIKPNSQKRDPQAGRPSVVLGINGAWGSGKTTIKNFTKHFLKENKNTSPYILVDFNPWEWSRKDQLLKGFIECLTNSLSEKNNCKSKKIRRKFLKLLSTFERGVNMTDLIWDQKLFFSAILIFITLAGRWVIFRDTINIFYLLIYLVISLSGVFFLFGIVKTRYPKALQT